MCLLNLTQQLFDVPFPSILVLKTEYLGTCVIVTEIILDVLHKQHMRAVVVCSVLGKLNL